MIELAITIKDDEHRYTHKELCYDPLTLDRDNQYLKDLVAKAETNLKADLHDPEITIKTTMVW